MMLTDPGSTKAMVDFKVAEKVVILLSETCSFVVRIVDGALTSPNCKTKGLVKRDVGHIKCRLAALI